MTLSALLVFCAVYTVAVATPGPGTAAIVARVLAQGAGGIAPFIAGFIVGDLVWFTLAATGLTVLVQAVSALTVVLKLAGAGYLAWMAWRLWTAEPAPDTLAAPATPRAPGRSFLAGLSLTLGNPKVILFFLALLPTLVDLAKLTPLAIVELWLVMSVILVVVFGTYVLAASQARRLFTGIRARRLINRITGTVMAGAAAAIMAR